MAITVNKNKPSVINTITELNGGSNGDWTIGASIVHNNNLGSYVEKPISELIEGSTYRVTYTLSGASCSTKVLLGNTVGLTRTSSGTYTETLVYTGPKKISFYNTGNANISYYKIELVSQVIDETIVDPDSTENRSWTLSYNPILNQWISFHSYLPNNYLVHPNHMLVKRNDSQLKLSNTGDYGKYFDTDIKPFIIETIFNDYPMETKVFDNVQSSIETKFGEITTNKFFDKALVYTESQCSGEIVLDLTNLTKKEKNWNFNKFLDITNNLSQSIFVSNWANTKTQYPIDKVVNVNKLDTNKPWYQRGRMRDKYMAVRFIENNLDNQKFFIKFVTSHIRVSAR